MRWTDQGSLFRFVVSSQRTALYTDPRGGLEKASHRHETCLPDMHSRSRSEPCRFDFFPLRRPGYDACSAERPTAGSDSKYNARGCTSCFSRCRTVCADSTAYALYHGSAAIGATDQSRGWTSRQVQSERSGERNRIVSKQRRIRKQPARRRFQ